MEYKDIKIGMRVKINLDKNDKEYSEKYDSREGIVDFIANEEDYKYDEYCIDVNVEMLTGEIEVGVLFKPSELEAVD